MRWYLNVMRMSAVLFVEMRERLIPRCEYMKMPVQLGDRKEFFHIGGKPEHKKRNSVLRGVLSGAQ